MASGGDIPNSILPRGGGAQLSTKKKNQIANIPNRNSGVAIAPSENRRSPKSPMLSR